jgi:LytS/YehU family sensor histidine kinase
MTMEGEPQDYRIAPLLLITFVENAFNHSVKGKTGRSFIHLNMEIRDGKFSFRLENNKGKVDEVEPENYKGLGLENVKRRLALLYPGRHGLTVREDEHIFTILLHLQL